MIQQRPLQTGAAGGDELFSADLRGEEGLAVGAGGLRQVPHLAVAQAQLRQEKLARVEPEVGFLNNLRFFHTMFNSA